MFRVLTCLTAEHDWRLVGLACAVSFIASIVAVNIFHRAAASRGRTRAIWIAIAGGAIGYGIWATHFIAMLAYDPGVGTGYQAALTAASLIAAMAVTTIGFAFAANDPHRWGPPLGGAIIGVGIASMHYLGMFALEVPGRVAWSLDLVILSIVLGVILGIAALSAAVLLSGKRGTLIAAALLALAIVSHHFTAMGAVLIVPDPARAFDGLYLPPNDLALAIAGVALSVLGMSFVGVLADRRLAVRTDKFQKIIDALSLAQRQVEASQRELQAQKFWLNTAINNMSQGLVLFDAVERIVVCNQRYIEMYSLSAEIVKPGCTLRDLIAHREETGSFSGDFEKYRASLLSDLAQGKSPKCWSTPRTGARSGSSISHCRMAAGSRPMKI